ncbi:MAG: PAS domain S-box protein, partial [Chloroflexota bacterium]|nr:PAS domain S-box protein [Chloroflexota bacterium]
GVLTLRLALPVFDDQGRRAGIIVLNLRGEEIRAYVSRLSTEEHEDIWVWDETGVELINIMHPELEGRNTYEYLQQTGDETLLALTEKMLAGGRGTALYLWPENGGEAPTVKKLVAYTPLYPVEGQMWTVGVSVPYETILAAHRQTRDTLLVLGGGIVAAILVGAFLIVRAECRRAESSLQESEEQLRATLASMDDLVFTLDEKSVLVDYYQPELTVELHGSPEVFIGKPYQEALPPNVVQPAKAAIETLKSTGAPQRFDYSLMLAGQEKWFSMTISLRKDTSGQFAGITAVARDITTRVQAEQALREERNFAESLVNTAQIIILVLDVEGRIVRFNPYLEALSGYSLAEVQSQDWFSTFLLAQDHSSIRALYQKAVADIQTNGNVNSIVTKDGHARQIEWYNKTLKDVAGNVRGVLAIGQDVTARQQAAEEIGRLSAVIEQTPVTVVITNLEGDIVYANPYFEVSTGYTVSAALGQNPRLLKSAQQEDAFYQELWETITAGQTWHGTFINKRQDGELYHEEATIFPFKNATGEIESYVAVKQDITTRVRAEERQAQLLAQQVAVNELALALGKTRDLDQLYTIIREHVCRLIEADAFIISFYDDETQLIHAACVYYEGRYLEVSNIPPLPLEEEDRGTQSRVIRTGEPFYNPDYRETEKVTNNQYTIQGDGTVLMGSTLPAEPPEPEISSGLYVPMKVEGQVIGVMQVQNYQLDAYCQEDINLLAALANISAIAIQNFRLLKQISQQARQIEQTINAVPEGVILLDPQCQIVLANPLGEKDLVALAGVQVGDELTQLNGVPLVNFRTSTPGGGWHELQLEGEAPQHFELLARPLESGLEQQGWVLVIRNVTSEWEARARTQRQERLAAIGQLSAGIAHDFRN